MSQSPTAVDCLYPDGHAAEHRAHLATGRLVCAVCHPPAAELEAAGWRRNETAIRASQARIAHSQGVEQRRKATGRAQEREAVEREALEDASEEAGRERVDDWPEVPEDAGEDEPCTDT